MASAAERTNSTSGVTEDCSVCSKPCEKEKGNFAQCSFCRQFLHGSCLKQHLPPAQMKAKLFENPACLFVCDVCRGPGAIVDMMKSLVEENRRLSERLSKIESQLSSSTSGQSSSVASDNFDTVFAAVSEYFERKEKRNNAVIHFLPGDGGATSEPSDTARVKELVGETGNDPATVERTFRMGRPRSDGKPRPLKVIMNNGWAKKALISGQKRLRDAHPDLNDPRVRFFVRDDLTERQRAKDQQQRQELAKLRSENPSKFLVIRDGIIQEKGSNGRCQPFQV
ncbi:MAG: hypothetical protein GY820_06770 [Gammaproteobacteria bacterium]|nr:hypothetical protein [Gammaproteobacteria bacterium]